MKFLNIIIDFVKISEFIFKMDEVTNIMSVLGVNSGYEEMVVRGAASLKMISQRLLAVPDKFGSTKNES